jgi:hypothetical protein
MLASYGPSAQAYAQRLGDVEAIVTDADSIGAAYVEAVRRRELNESFYGLLCVDDPRVAFGYKYADQILAQIPDYDFRRFSLHQLAEGTLPVNGQRVDTVWPFPTGFRQVATEFFALCDAVLVRSYAEYQPLLDWLKMDPTIIRPPRVVERILAVAHVPVVERERPVRPGVVIWAPQRPAAEMALHVHALSEFHGDITCVTAGGPPPKRGTATWVGANDPRALAALRTAAAVICAEPNDPSDAVAFGRLGYGVLAPLTSGAYEFVDDVVTWDALDAKALFPALAVAVSRPASVRGVAPRPPRAPVPPPRPAFVPADEYPLVSIITPTYNRPDELRRMLGAVAAQTYPNIESVVVNDGGSPVDHVVAEFPFARLIDKKVNEGSARTQRVGWENARGEYIGILPDDDWIYPDHVERLVNAMLRTGAKLAHGTAVLRYRESAGAEGWQTTGFNATTFSQTLVASDALISSTIGDQQMLVHRSVYEDVGWYVMDLDISDNEIHIRFSHKYFYAFVDHVTSEFRDHSGGQGRNCDFPAAMTQLYTVLHPVKDRPYIDEIRKSSIAHVAKRPPGQPAFAPTIRIVR